MLDAEARLRAPDLADQAVGLGFRGADVPDLLDAAQRVLVAGDSAVVSALADRLLPRIGAFADPASGGFPDPWADVGEDPYGAGVLPMLALLVTAAEVSAWHRRRGVPEPVSWASLADLGQQVWVHRQTYGCFGLHTHPWLLLCWSGALFWLGRLQFNLQTDADGAWELSTHIPQAGPLSPADVDASFAAAAAFFSRHFPDLAARSITCHSWLLDPALGRLLPAGSNLVRFQRRWELYGEPDPGDADVVFFVFHRRGLVEPSELPQQTQLQRVAVARWQRGEHWQSWHGRIPLRSAREEFPP